MTAVRAWWRRLSERRRAKHESPWPPGQFNQMKRTMWRLHRASKR